MTFRDAIQQMINTGVDHTATKRQSWKGYIYYSIPEGAAPGVYSIRYHYADGTHDVAMLVNNDTTDNIVKGKQSGHEDKVYKGTAETTEATLFEDYCPLTTFLMDAIINATDFEIGTKEAFDEAAEGDGEF